MAETMASVVPYLGCHKTPKRALGVLCICLVVYSTAAAYAASYNVESGGLHDPRFAPGLARW
jgi:hypothetical protein